MLSITHGTKTIKIEKNKVYSSNNNADWERIGTIQVIYGKPTKLYADNDVLHVETETDTLKSIDGGKRWRVS